MTRYRKAALAARLILICGQARQGDGRFPARGLPGGYLVKVLPRKLYSVMLSYEKIKSWDDLQLPPIPSVQTGGQSLQFLVSLLLSAARRAAIRKIYKRTF